jgi:hypothetical protein
MVLVGRSVEEAMAALGATAPRNLAGNGGYSGSLRGLEIGRLFGGPKGAFCGWTPRGKTNFQDSGDAKRRLFGSNHGA